MRDFVWRTPDHEGVGVVLERSVWEQKILHPVLGHPEVREYLDQIRLTVQAPEAVYASLRDTRSKLFYSTAFITRALKRRGTKLWPKSAS